MITSKWFFLGPQKNLDVFYAVFRKSWGMSNCAHREIHLKTRLNLQLFINRNKIHEPMFLSGFNSYMPSLTRI